MWPFPQKSMFSFLNKYINTLWTSIANYFCPQQSLVWAVTRGQSFIFKSWHIAVSFDLNRAFAHGLVFGVFLEQFIPLAESRTPWFPEITIPLFPQDGPSLIFLELQLEGSSPNCISTIIPDSYASEPQFTPTCAKQAMENMPLFQHLKGVQQSFGMI